MRNKLTKNQWRYVSILLSMLTFTVLTPALFEHIKEGYSLGLIEIAIAWIICGINLVIRLIIIGGVDIAEVAEN